MRQATALTNGGFLCGVPLPRRSSLLYSNSRCIGRRQQCAVQQPSQRQCIVARTGGSRKKDRKPDTKNALDTTMAWGDILTLFATELVRTKASERIPLSLCGIHCSISILTWVAVAGLKGDYQLQVADTWFGGQRQAMFTAICSGAMTWALFVPAVLAGYAYMVSSHMLDPDALMGHERQAQLPAQLEVIFASLWSVGSWRGIYAGLRPYI